MTTEVIDEIGQGVEGSGEGRNREREKQGPTSSLGMSTTGDE